MAVRILGLWGPAAALGMWGLQKCPTVSKSFGTPCFRHMFSCHGFNSAKMPDALLRATSTSKRKVTESDRSRIFPNQVAPLQPPESAAGPELSSFNTGPRRRGEAPLTASTKAPPRPAHGAAPSNLANRCLPSPPPQIQISNDKHEPLPSPIRMYSGYPAKVPFLHRLRSEYMATLPQVTDHVFSLCARQPLSCIDFPARPAASKLLVKGSTSTVRITCQDPQMRCQDHKKTAT